MKPELVGKVRRDLQSAWTDSKDNDGAWWSFMAKYALDLAERVAAQAVLASRLSHEPWNSKALEAAIERAVEGT